MQDLRQNEVVLGALFFIVSLLCGVWAYFITPGFYQSLLAGITTTLFGVSAALFAVNVYLGRRSRKSAISALLKLVSPSIEENHSKLLNEAWTRFGKPQFRELIQRYEENNGDPQALDPSERDTLYDMIKPKKLSYDRLLNKLEQDLKELTFILGWSFDPEILRNCFSCRHAIAKFRDLALEDSLQNKYDICEQFIDIDLYSFQALEGLKRLQPQKKEVNTAK